MELAVANIKCIGVSYEADSDTATKQLNTKLEAYGAYV